MKKFLSLIVFSLMLTSFTQIVCGWGAIQTIPVTGNLPVLPYGWMIIDIDWHYYDWKIIDLNNAPYGTTVKVLQLDNMPTGWVDLGPDGNGHNNIKCLIHDTTPPTTPGNPKYTITATSVTLSWLASTDLVGLTGYKIYKDNILVGSTTATSYTVNGLTPNTGYSFAVTATDAENESVPSIVSVNTILDYDPPTSPTNLICEEKYDTSLKLSWSASTDNVAVAGYDIYMNGVQIGSTKNLSYTVSNLEHNSTYVFLIKAYDAVGNTSFNNNPSLTVLMDSNLIVIPYIAGTYYDGSKQIPCYWQGSTRVDLAEDGFQNAICVSGDTVYTAGNFYDGGKSTPCYWKGTNRVDLPTKGYGGTVQSMCVSGGIIYTAGWVSDGVKNIPCYWKGSTRVDLVGDGKNNACAQAIYVSGDTVYTAGEYYGNDGSIAMPCYWKGTTRVDLVGNKNDSSYANDIYVSRDTVYTVGFYCAGGKSIPCYWKGSMRVDFAGDEIDGVAWAIYVSGDTVYISGNYDDGSKSIPCYWKGSTRIDLAGDGIHDAYTDDICVSGDTVYIDGSYNDGSKFVPCYWKGSTRVDLAVDGNYSASIHDMFVPN